MKKVIAILSILCFSLAGYSQQKLATGGYLLPAVIIDGDTLGIVHVPRVYVFPKLQFTSNDDYVKYRRLVRDVKKMYPYVLIAKHTFMEVQMIMDSLPNNRQRSNHVKAKEQELWDLYAKELMSCSVHQGEILIKLVNRELNYTPYDIIKDLRGNFSAIMWQGMARTFGESLKSSYDMDGEDKLIERIVLQLEQGTI